MINKKPIIAFDLDGTMGDLLIGLSKMCSIITGTTVKPEEWINYDHFITIGVTADQFISGIVDHFVLENATPYYGLSEAISFARQQGYDIAVITARGFHPDGENITYAWFEKHGVDIDHIIVVGQHETKITALQSLGNVVAYIDDYLPHLHAIDEANLDIELYLMDQPWNSEDTKFSRLFSVREFVDAAINTQDNRLFA